MIIKTGKTIPSSEITDEQVFKHRRLVIKSVLAATGASIFPALASDNKSFANLKASEFSLKEIKPTPAESVKNYTNYYEFSFNKEDSTQLAQKLITEPWVIEITGAVEKPIKLHIDDILKQQTLEERIYRFRCVEAWSMVVPWIGFPLSNILKLAKPLSTAQFVKFTSVLQPETMPNQFKNALLSWPYTEGLRMDEAMHPLTILSVGMYGEILPKQNGAPLRLIVPWKYGFKSIKAIVKIELVENPPLTAWNESAPTEYGFYANVNPNVAHPRWSQSSERVLGSGFFTPRRQTELFNGYAEQVSALYSGMNLQAFF